MSNSVGWFERELPCRCLPIDSSCGRAMLASLPLMSLPLMSLPHLAIICCALLSRVRFAGLPRASGADKLQAHRQNRWAWCGARAGRWAGAGLRSSLAPRDHSVVDREHASLTAHSRLVVPIFVCSRIIGTRHFVEEPTPPQVSIVASIGASTRVDVVDMLVLHWGGKGRGPCGPSESTYIAEQRFDVTELCLLPCERAH